MLSPNITAGPRGDAPLSISRVNSRATSREGTAGNTVDPVLARYLTIKRDLDRAGVLPSTEQHSGTTASPSVAPQHVSLGTPNASNRPTRGGGDAQTPGVVRGAGASGTYSYPPTTTERRGQEDARSLLSSPATTGEQQQQRSRLGVGATTTPTGNAAAGGTPTIPWNDRLSARYEARQARQRSALQEASASLTALERLEASSVVPSSTDTSARANDDTAHTALSMMDRSGGMTENRRASSRSDVEQLALAMADSEAARVHAEQLAEMREKEIMILRQRLAMDDGDHRHHHNSNSSAASANASRDRPSAAAASTAKKTYSPIRRSAVADHSSVRDGGDRSGRRGGGGGTREEELAAASLHGADGGGDGKQLRLQGRLDALERMVRDKDDRLDTETQRALTLERQSHELARHVEELQLELYSRDQRGGYNHGGTVDADSWRTEVERLQEALADAQRQIKDERRRTLIAESQLDGRSSEAEDALLQYREQLRDARRRILELETQVSSSDEGHAHMLSDLKESRNSLEACEAERRELETRLREVQVKLDNMKSLSAQESIVNDELKYDVERYKKVSANLRDELNDHEQSRKHLEAALREARADAEMKVGLEGKLKTAAQTTETLTIEVEGLQSQLADTKQRLDEANEERSKIPMLEDQMAQLRASVQGKQLSIEKQQVTLQDTLREVDRLKVVVKESEAREEQVLAELANTQDRLVHQEHVVAEKEATLKQLGDVMATYEKLRQSIDEKTRYIVQQQDVVDDLRRRNAELDADVETLLCVKRQIDELAVERQQLLEQVAHLDAENAELHREALGQQQACRTRGLEITDLKELIASLEAQNHRCKSQMQDAVALDRKLKETLEQLADATEALAREKQAKDDISARLASREERVLEHQQRIQGLEAQVTALHRELAQAQVEQGRLGVVVEAHDKEKQRMQSELESKISIVDQVTVELSCVRKELQQAKLDLQTFSVKEKLEGDRSASVAQQQKQREEEAERLRAALLRAEGELHRREEQLANARSAAEKGRSATEQLDETNALLRRRDDECVALQQQLKQCRTQLADVQSVSAASQKAEARLTAAKEAHERQAHALEQLERDDAAKQRLLLERERENHRLKDRLSAAGADIEAERHRKRQLEDRVRELEAECQRASALDGQVAGLNLVIAQRNKDLEEERAVISELRNKLRQAGATAAHQYQSASVDTSSRSASQQLSVDADARLAVKEEHLRQVQDELRRAHQRVEVLQQELTLSETRREELRAELRELSDTRDREVSQWALKHERLQRAMDRAQEDGSAATLALKAKLTAEQDRVRALENAMSSDERRRASVGEGEELRRAKGALEIAEADKARMQLELHDRSIELEIASENLSTLQARLRDRQQPSRDRTALDGGGYMAENTQRAASPPYDNAADHDNDNNNATAGPLDAPRPLQLPGTSNGRSASHGSATSSNWDVATAEETIQQWRIKRKRQMEQEQIAQAQYDAHVRSKLPPSSSAR